MKGKLIVIEGTDCSGKETQTKLLVKYLKENNTKVFTMSFPNYDSPTGKIIGGPFLGKSYISEGYFPEGAPNVDPKVSSLYYAADRLYNLPIIQKKLNEGYTVILDRYVYSNMAHQGGKWKTKEERDEMYNWLSKLEFDLLELLVTNQNKVYSRENLLNLVWGYEYPGDVRTVDVHVRRLREKIESNPSEPKYVHTKWGVGYYYAKNS